MTFFWQNPTGARTTLGGTTVLDQKSQDKLEEQYVDATSMQAVLLALEDIAYEKSEHVASNWGDKELAKAWVRVGKAIGDAAFKAKKEGL